MWRTTYFYKVINSDIPRDDDIYNKDLEVYFSKYVRDKIEKVHDGNKNIYKKINDDLLKQAKDYFYIDWIIYLQKLNL